MHFSMYVSCLLCLGLTLSTRLEHCPLYRSSEHTISSSPYEPFRHVPTLPHHHLLPYDLPSIVVALFEPLWVSHWQGGGMALDDGSNATVSGTTYTSCSAEVSACTWGPLQPGNVAHVNVLAINGSHQHTPLHSSTPLTHTPHTHPCGWVLTLCLAGDYGASVRPSAAWPIDSTWQSW